MIGLNVADLGITRGMVVSTNDPLKLCRVQIRVPQIHGVEGSINYRPDEELPWAYPCLPPNVYVVPKVQDFVWITFENNNLSMPIYLGVVLGKQSSNPANPQVYGNINKNRDVAPSSYEAPYESNAEGTIFQTVGGFNLKYNDNDDTVTLEKEDMSIVTKSNNIKATVKDTSLEITEAGINTTLGDSDISVNPLGVTLKFGSNTITLNASGIILQVGTTKINILPTNIQTISSTIDLNAIAELNLDSSTVNVNGDPDINLTSTNINLNSSNITGLPE